MVIIILFIMEIGIHAFMFPTSFNCCVWVGGGAGGTILVNSLM